MSTISDGIATTVGGGDRTCSGNIKQDGRLLPCRAAVKYPDADGVRWWCGNHNPDRKAKPKSEAKSEAKSETVVTRFANPLGPAPVDPPQSSKGETYGVANGNLMFALLEAQKALLGIAGINAQSLLPGASIETYRTLIKEAADMAKKAAGDVAMAIHKYGS